jgi:hypothetical protein
VEAYYTFVKKIIDAFEKACIDYAFTGALATSFYGVPRTTSDVDVIVEVASEGDVKVKLSCALRLVGLAVNEREIDKALHSGFMIASFRDKTSPYSIDVILSGERLDKRAGKIADLDTFFQSPEGLIVAKLRMIKDTLPPERSAKDKTDVKSILEFTKVDVEAVKQQARKDNTLGIFEALTVG